MGDALPGIHKARLKVMFAGVEALLRGQRLWLAALGRNVGGRTLEKHKIKRVERLQGNRRLSSERQFQAVPGTVYLTLIPGLKDK